MFMGTGNNTANRWGGGVYAGLSPPWYSNWAPPFTINKSMTPVFLVDGRLSGNICHAPAQASSFRPSQIAMEQIAATLVGLNFNLTEIIGGTAGEDIGVYTCDSIAPSTVGTIFTSVAADVVQE
jgi:hypothetical protein